MSRSLGYMTGRNDRAQSVLKAQGDTLKSLEGKVAKLDKSGLPSVLHIDKVVIKFRSSQTVRKTCR